MLLLSIDDSKQRNGDLEITIVMMRGEQWLITFLAVALTDNQCAIYRAIIIDSFDH